jgi:lysophospholipase L1-like esterase
MYKRRTLSLFFLLSLFSSLHAVTKIMPLGDSITFDWYYGDSRSDAYRNGYRNDLWYKLKSADYTVDFVGSQKTGGAVSPSFDGDNEGHTGWTTYQIADHTYNWLKTYKPDIVLLHIGTNDSMYYSSSDMTGVESILNQIDRYERDYDVTVKVVLAKIINLSKNPSWISQFNSSLTTMAQNRIADGDEITLVDMYHALSYWGDMVDGIHPKSSGYAKMATVWFNALKKVMKEDTAFLIPVYHIILNP